MNTERLLGLVLEAARGKENIEEGVIGCLNYSFLFRDMNYITKYVNFFGSGRVSLIGTSRKVIQDWKNDRFNEDSDSLRHYRRKDILLIGSIKSLVPTLIFGGGYEHLFEVWMFIKTPEDKRFLATLYYGPTGLAIGGWDPNFVKSFISDKKILSKFSKFFKNLINFSPHDFSEEEKEAFVEALERALSRVPVSEFYGVYKHDFGNLLIGIKNGRPFMVELGFSPTFNKYDLILNTSLKLNISQEEFENLDFH